MSTHGTFATVIGCMDGRCQEKTTAYAKQLFGADHIDNITEPGANGILADVKHPLLEDINLREYHRTWMKKKAEVSVNGHGSKQCLLVAHCECAGNPVDYEDHVLHLRRAAEVVRKWNLFDEVRTAVFNPQWEMVDLPSTQQQSAAA